MNVSPQYSKSFDRFKILPNRSPSVRGSHTICPGRSQGNHRSARVAASIMGPLSCTCVTSIGSWSDVVCSVRAMRSALVHPNNGHPFRSRIHTLHLLLVRSYKSLSPTVLTLFLAASLTFHARSPQLRRHCVIANSRRFAFITEFHFLFHNFKILHAFKKSTLTSQTILPV